MTVGAPYLRRQIAHILLISATFGSILILLFSLDTGQTVILQYFISIPIIFACIIYSWRGFLFSCILIGIYIALLIEFPLENFVISQIMAQILFFVSMAGVVAYLSATIHHSEQILEIQHELNLELNRALRMNEALDLILSAALKFKGLDCGGIYLVDPVSGSLDLVISKGLSQQFIEHAQHYDVKSPHVIHAKTGIAKYGRYSAIRPEIDIVRDSEHLKALAMIPILYEGELVSLMNLASHTTNTIPKSTKTALELLAMQVGTALIRVRSQDEVWKSETRFRAIFNSAFHFIAVLTPEGIVQEINETALSFFSTSREEVVGKSLMESPFLNSSEEYRERFRQAVSQVLVDTYIRREIKLKRSGKDIFIDFSLRSITDIDGNVTALLAEGIDITERINLERQNADAFMQIQKNLAQLAYLNDEVRNPLSCILSLAEMVPDRNVSENILAHVDRIDGMIRQIDTRWFESEKILDYLRKHHHIFFDIDTSLNNADMPDNRIKE